ncbi:MAG: RnfABCDGE type electron transport complex subunit D, partial [Solirubrobacteraceae bacterium]
MTGSSIASAGAARVPSILIGSRRIPVVLPSRRDPRLRLSAVIVTLQILGQAVLGFKVSIAQILVSVGVAAVIETAVTWRRDRVLMWPASALLTGNSVAFILRASGTRHGDWWSLHGIQYFILAVVLSLASKYFIRVGNSHIFNPSNVGLVATLLVIGPVHVFPQYLWWGPSGTPLTLALIVILAGAIWVLRSVRMTTMALAFLIPFAALVGVLAAGGQSFIAIWHTGPVSGASYWLDICLSPEVLIFVFFMMPDPKTAPRTRPGQIVFGTGTALLAVGLLALQPTEFGIKIAILASLTVSCALSPLVG